MASERRRGGVDRPGPGWAGGSGLPPAGATVAAGCPEPSRRFGRPRAHGRPGRAAVVGQVAPGHGHEPRRRRGGSLRRRAGCGDRDGGPTGRRHDESESYHREPKSGRSRADRWRAAPATASRSSTFVTIPGQILIPVLYLAAMAGMSAWWLFGQILLWRVTRAARPAPRPCATSSSPSADRPASGCDCWRATGSRCRSRIPGLAQ